MLTLTFSLFFFNDTATTEIYTLSLHDALPIWPRPATKRSMASVQMSGEKPEARQDTANTATEPDRKSTRLNSSHSQISYAVFCLKKKNQISRRNSMTAKMLNNRCSESKPRQFS